MKAYLKSGATILLSPDGTWNWSGWDGHLTVQSYVKPLQLTNDNIIIESDVPQFKLLLPRNYTSIAFSDIPGIITNAVFIVDEPTLSDILQINGFFPLLLTTTGTFTCFCTSPSIRVTMAGPIPDPILVKNGTWKVIEPNQQVMFKKPADTGIGEPCNESEVPNMDHRDKLWAAIKQSEPGKAAYEEVGGAEGIAAIVAVGVIFAMVPGGALVELLGVGVVLVATAALTVAGALLSGHQVKEGIQQLGDFYQQTKDATSCTDIADASNSFGSAIAKIGLGVVGLGAAFKAAKTVSNLGELAQIETNAAKNLRKLESETPGAHFESRHGASTTRKQQKLRATKGQIPPGNEIGSLKDSSRFLKASDQLESYNKGMEHYKKTGLKSFIIEMDRPVGEGYTMKEGIYKQTSRVQVVIRKDKIYNLYPFIK